MPSIVVPAPHRLPGTLHCHPGESRDQKASTGPTLLPSGGYRIDDARFADNEKALSRPAASKNLYGTA